MDLILRIVFCATLFPAIPPNTAATYETVVINKPEDILSPGWSINPACAYHDQLPNFQCDQRIPVNLTWEGIGFWAHCHQACDITYERQANETLLNIEVIPHRDPSCPNHCSRITAYLDNNGFYPFYCNEVDPENTTLGTEIVVERIQKIVITPPPWYFCESGTSGFYLIDKIILRKQIGPESETIDVIEDLGKHWGYSDTCMYQRDRIDLVCDGKNVTSADDGYIGTGFWVACGGFCHFDYAKQKGETVQKIEIKAIHDPGSYFNIVVRMCRFFNARCIDFSVKSEQGPHQIIDFRDYVVDPHHKYEEVFSVSISIPYEDRDTGNHILLDTIILHKSVAKPTEIY